MTPTIIKNYVQDNLCSRVQNVYISLNKILFTFQLQSIYWFIITEVYITGKSLQLLKKLLFTNCHVDIHCGIVSCIYFITIPIL